MCEKITHSIYFGCNPSKHRTDHPSGITTDDPSENQKSWIIRLNPMCENVLKYNQIGQIIHPIGKNSSIYLSELDVYTSNICSDWKKYNRKRDIYYRFQWDDMTQNKT